MDWIDWLNKMVRMNDRWVGMPPGEPHWVLIGNHLAFSAALHLDIMIWLLCACLGGIATILGGLMVMGSLLLWWVPQGSPKSGAPTLPAWQGRLKVLAVAGVIAIAGMGVFAIVPYPFRPQ